MKTRKQGTQRKEEWGESSTQNEMRKERKQSEKKIGWKWKWAEVIRNEQVLLHP
jgi:hypothetical protein